MPRTHKRSASAKSHHTKKPAPQLSLPHLKTAGKQSAQKGKGPNARHASKKSPGRPRRSGAPPTPAEVYQKRKSPKHPLKTPRPDSAAAENGHTTPKDNYSQHSMWESSPSSTQAMHGTPHASTPAQRLLGSRQASAWSIGGLMSRIWEALGL